MRVFSQPRPSEQRCFKSHKQISFVIQGRAIRAALDLSRADKRFTASRDDCKRYSDSQAVLHRFGKLSERTT
jgi:hypothetical protein